MKRVSRIVASAALSGSLLAVCGGTASAANLLVDPGFETPSANPTDVVLPTTQAGAALNPTYPWYGLLTTSGDQGEISSDIPAFVGGPTPPPADRINSGTGGTSTTGGYVAHAGDQYDYTFTVGQPSGTVGGVAQLVSLIVPGDTFVGSAYFFKKQFNSSDGDRFQAGGSYDSLKLIFEDALGNPVGSPVLSTIGGGGTTAGRVDSTSPNSTWVQVMTAPAIAPVGATQVLFEMNLTRGATGGVQFGDDADLEDTSLVPEPASLGLLATALALVPRRRRR